MREIIVARFPCSYRRYVEVFGGAGWVFFHKPKDPEEVINDYNGLIANLYWCVGQHPEELVEELRYVLSSRENFHKARILILEQADDLPAVKRAALFYQLIRQSYASGLNSFSGSAKDMWRNFPPILQANRRIKQTLIEHRDFEQLIREQDGADTFFYCDPPYLGTEDFYKNIGKNGFTLEDHLRLRETLLSIKGKFLLSYADHEYVRGLYERPDIFIEHHTRIHNMRQRTEAGALFHELLIANYDMSQREREIPQQLAFFLGEEDPPDS